MSILIKGMDKPTDCGVCPFEDFGYCSVKGERNTSERGIDADCPLIEIADRKTEPQTETKTETQNSNLTFEKRTMRDCYNCERYETEDECIECHYEPKDECAKEYEELGLKELKELIEADRKTEPTISKMEQVDKDINVRSKDEPQTAECPFDDTIPCEWVCTEYGKCKYKPKTEPQTMYYPQVDGITPSVIVKTEPQTEKCPHDSICAKPCKECGACEEECGMWKALKDIPQTENE